MLIEIQKQIIFESLIRLSRINEYNLHLMSMTLRCKKFTTANEPQSQSRKN
jgi:hypothetical protein